MFGSRPSFAAILTVLLVSGWAGLGSAAVTREVPGIGATRHLGTSPIQAQAPPRARPRLAYAAHLPGSRKEAVFTVAIDGSHRRRLTFTGSASWPTWSPDGQQIAYMNKGRLMVMRSDGQDKKVLVGGWEYGSPSWSPDGGRVAFVRSTDAGLQIALVDVATRTVVSVTTPTKEWPEAVSPDWSPDGTRIAFVRGSSAPLDDYTNISALFTVHVDGSGLTRFTGRGEVSSPDWSPKGQFITYATKSTSRNGESFGDAYSIRADRSQRHAVMATAGKEDQPVWSPDGAWIALHSNGPRVGVGEQPEAHSLAGVWLVRRDGTHPGLLLRGAEMPDWQPGVPPEAGGFGLGLGTTLTPQTQTLRQPIVFCAATRQGLDMFVLRPAGKVTRLTSDGRSTWPSVYRMGTRVVYDRSFKKPSTALFWPAIWSKRLDGSDARRILQTAGGLGQPAWSPDRRLLALTRDGQIFIYNTRTKAFHRVTRDADQPTWSPKGRWIAFVRHSGSSDRASLFVVRPDGTGLRRLTTMNGAVAQPDWSPTSRWIAFAHLPFSRFLPPTSSGVSGVYAIRSDGSGRHVVMRTPLADDSPSWSRTGRKIILYSDGPKPFGANPRPGIWRVNPDGSHRTLLLRSRSVVDVDW